MVTKEINTCPLLLKRRQYICKVILKITHSFSFFLCLSLFAQAFGQSDSSKKIHQKIRPVFISLQDIESLKHNIQAFDTSLSGFSQINPFRKQGMPYQDLGLIGTPSQPLSINGLKPSGFNLGFNTMDAWFFPINGSDDKLVMAPSAYTKLNYAQGDKELIFIELLHTQNITKRWNFGLEYSRLKTNNYLYYNLSGQVYSKIRISNLYNAKLFSSFRSKSDKYYVLGAITFNKSLARETGGLSNPLSFDTTFGQLRVFNNPLINATNSVLEPAVNFTQFFRFGKTSLITQKKDSSRSDTLGLNFSPKGYFFHTLNASQSRFQFEDPTADTPYYKPHFTHGINDSMVLKTFTNSVGFLLKTLYKNITNISKASAEYSNIGVFNSIIGQLAYSNFSLKADHNTSLNSKYGDLQFNAHGQWFLAGFNASDYLMMAGLQWTYKNRTKLCASVSSQQHQVDHFQTIGFTSPIKWNQSLSPTQRRNFEASIDYLPWKLKAGLQASKFQNFVLYFPNAAPQGIDFDYLHLFVSHQIKLRKFYWQNRIGIQEAGKIYPLPKFYLAGGIFIENKFFKKNMLARIGFDYHYNSQFYASAYDPSIRQFVWQNTTRIGHYPYIDFYLSAQVQTMNIYIRFEHVNQGLSGTRYYATPNYPNPPRFLRFGVNWRLFN